MTQGRTPIFLKIAALTMASLALCLAVALGIGIWQSRKLNNQRQERLTREGYRIVQGETLVFTNRLTLPTWFQAMNVSVLDGSEAGIAMYCATGLIRGVVKGPVLFVGQHLTVAADAVIEKDLETTCQRLDLQGRVKGLVLGTTYLMNSNAPAAPVATPR